MYRYILYWYVVMWSQNRAKYDHDYDLFRGQGGMLWVHRKFQTHTESSACD